MALFDLPLPELERYRPDRDEPADFDAFWNETLEVSRGRRQMPDCVPIDVGLRTLTVFDVTFGGYCGQPIKAWYLRPASAPDPLPCVVEFAGYGGGRGEPTERLLWASAGYACLLVDSRGQLRASTPDRAPDALEAHAPGHLTLGITDPKTYYYRRLVADAVLAIDAATELTGVDADRIAVAGTSQGGGLALAVAGLDHRPKALVADLPFLSHFRRALAITSRLPYGELASYLAANPDRADRAFRTLSYVDGLNFAARARCPALFSVGLADDICPPSTVFAAYNHYAGPKELRVYPHAGHEGGGAAHDRQRLAFFAQHIADPGG